MHSLLNAIILGLIQGLTEFLPVSSSGHLVLFSSLLNFDQSGIAFDVFVHLGTLLSVLLVFRKELIQMILAPYAIWIQKSEDPDLKEFLRWDMFVVIATIPAVIVGLFFKDAIEQAFQSVLLVFFMLILTGLFMFLTQFLKNQDKPFGISNSFIIGIAQAFAILPGISRSGSTIFAGIAQGIDRVKAAKFSFIMSIPAILGAAILQLKDIVEKPLATSELLVFITGGLMSAITGYLAIIWLLKIVQRGSLQWFGYYCFTVGSIGIIWYFVH